MILACALLFIMQCHAGPEIDFKKGVDRGIVYDIVYAGQQERPLAVHRGLIRHTSGSRRPLKYAIDLRE